MSSCQRSSENYLCCDQVRPGDVLVVGSDGLWDNLSTKQILEEVILAPLYCAHLPDGPACSICLRQAKQSRLEKNESASSLALKLATSAFHHSVDRSGQTPYSLGASEAFDMVYSGAPHARCLKICVIGVQQKSGCPTKVSIQSARAGPLADVTALGGIDTQYMAE